MLLNIENLHLEFKTFDGISKVLAGVNLVLERGDVMALVGETGCGKSMTALSVARLIPKQSGEITDGRILFDGIDILGKDQAALRRFRARRLGMIFQDPTTNLNPLFTIREQLVDAVLYQCHEAGDVPGLWRGFLPSSRQLRQDALSRAVELMEMVGIPDGNRRIEEYPHQFSGGMRQRVLIAMALAGKPDLLIADEPTTALDVTIQAQILKLIINLVDKLNLSVLLITHNLGVVAKTCQKAAVMYAGRVVEQAPVRELFKNPRHPYTQGLIQAVPTRHTVRGSLEGIPGLIPNLNDPPAGCRFHPRCERAIDICRSEIPANTVIKSNHQTACHLY
ncbi:MAG: ABC transporter ATP-binding protein [Acidiferrobacteraceae bacterium]|nr:ABC transporter ATP-binding protein [Acidiferrobacteraceae bacterium]